MSLFYSNIDNRKFNTWCIHTQRLDTYGCGCQHDCNYCYAKALLNFRGLWNSKLPKNSDLYEIKKCISELQKNKVVKLGGMTDCFMPLELKNRVTYNTIKLLNYYKIHYLIVTKSSIVSNDEYLAIYDKNLAHFQISITSTKNSISKNIENASLPKQRIKAIEKLYKNGFDVSIRLSPFIFDFIDIKLINSIECDKILIEFLKVNHWVKKWFKIDYSEYSLNYGGYNHLQLKNKIDKVNAISVNKKSVGEYVKEHHEYFRDNVNYNRYDCCNLNFKPKENILYTQQKLF